jgi:peptide chain release factor 2
MGKSSAEVVFDDLKKIQGLHRVYTLEKGKRHTCFVSIRVVEEVEPDTIKINWDKDVRVDTFRAGGKGGQKQNKTDSGVRMVYEPLHIKVESRTERSQLINKDICKKRLASLIADYNTPEAERFRGVMTFGKNDFTYWDHEMKDWWKKRS